jgi:uncharacterized protein (DUF608 family)
MQTMDYKDLIIEMTVKEKSELKTYVLDSKDFETKVGKIVKEKIKNDKELEDMVVDITKNVLTQLYKTLWIKRNFWKTTLSNKST